jgi:hypothetical protein
MSKLISEYHIRGIGKQLLIARIADNLEIWLRDKTTTSQLSSSSVAYDLERRINILLLEQKVTHF